MGPRYFISLDIAVDVAERLMALQRELEPHLLAAALSPRWTHPEQLHISLKYLGPLEPALIGHIEQAIEALVDPLFPFQVQSRGAEFKPDFRRPRLLFNALDEKGAEVVSLLHKALNRELNRLGIQRASRPFHPGVLLGRMRSLSPQVEVEASTLKAFSERDLGTSTVKDFALMSAERRGETTRYDVLNRFTLGGRHEPI